MIKNFKDKTILVTGGAGSIGSALVKQILHFEPKAVRVFDNHEYSLHMLEQSFSSNENREKLRFLLGDVTDKDRVERAMNGVDIVYHAAAYKHVHLCEYNPLEAVKTNVIGTQNVIDAALGCDVKKFVFISTDKAVHPIGTLGASKLLGEKITTAANYYKGNAPTMFSSVRFGNVTMSNGSVIPHFIKQAKLGLPLTVTSSEMTRFLMPLHTAVDLIFKATMNMRGGEVFVLKMKSANIKDLATVIINEYGKKDQSKSRNLINIQKVGSRAGEKMHERLIAEEESNKVVELDDMLVILSSIDPLFGGGNNPFMLKAKKINPNLYSSDRKPMSIKQLKVFLQDNNINK